MINLSGCPDKFYTNDQFGETIIKLYKEKVRPSSNTKLDKFLQEVIAPNVLSLWKIKEVMAKATWFISHGNHHLLVGSTFDLSLLVKILVEDKIFKLEPGRDAKDTKFVDLFACGSSKIGLGSLLKEYQHWAQGNWKTGLAQDDNFFEEYETEDLEDELDRRIDLSDSI